MLVLNRRIGESIIIDGNIKIKILGDGTVVRVGIEAPRHINVVREELIERRKLAERINKPQSYIELF